MILQISIFLLFSTLSSSLDERVTLHIAGTFPMESGSGGWAGGEVTTILTFILERESSTLPGYCIFSKIRRAVPQCSWRWKTWTIGWTSSPATSWTSTSPTLRFAGKFVGNIRKHFLNLVPARSCVSATLWFPLYAPDKTHALGRMQSRDDSYRWGCSRVESCCGSSCAQTVGNKNFVPRYPTEEVPQLCRTERDSQPCSELTHQRICRIRLDWAYLRSLSGKGSAYFNQWKKSLPRPRRTWR